MRISIISTHSFPITKTGTITHTGDIVIVDLVYCLEQMGHEVIFTAPEGSYIPSNGKLLSMVPSWGKYPPSYNDIETDIFNKHADIFRQSDIVHDFSVGKTIVNNLRNEGKKNTLCTLLGGAWTYNYPPYNLITWSNAHKDRVIRGADDFENTPTPFLAGNVGKPVKNARVVYGGVDTNFYVPTYNKKDYVLWMGRWSKVRGYIQAIEIAKHNPHINFVFSGGHPDYEYFSQERECALEAIKLTKGISNIKIDLLPADPNHHLYKRKLYQEAKAFLYNVQFNEPFGLMQAEALACGTPVIGTNYGSVPEVIENGKTGYVCNNNINDFSLALNMIDNINPTTCRIQAVNRFDIKIMAQSYLNEYNKILGGEQW